MAWGGLDIFTKQKLASQVDHVVLRGQRRLVKHIVLLCWAKEGSNSMETCIGPIKKSISMEGKSRCSYFGERSKHLWCRRDGESYLLVHFFLCDQEDLGSMVF